MTKKHNFLYLSLEIATQESLDCRFLYHLLLLFTVNQFFHRFPLILFRVFVVALF